eukprot:1090928-Amphidinium_carterae.1
MCSSVCGKRMLVEARFACAVCRQLYEQEIPKIYPADTFAQQARRDETHCQHDQSSIRQSFVFR